MIAYADTSFFVALYAPDAHSAVAQKIMARRPTLFLTSFSEAELANALELRVFRRELGRRQVNSAHAKFQEHVAAGVFLLVPVPATLYELCGRIARRRTARMGPRTLDVLHVAAALSLKAGAFYTFDDQQGASPRRRAEDSAHRDLKVLSL